MVEKRDHKRGPMSDDERRLAQDAFLQVFRQHCSYTDAYKAAGVAHDTPRYWMKNDVDGFAERYKAAEQEVNDKLEAELYRRAVEGVEKKRGVWHQGTKVGEEAVREYSDILLIFMLKARLPWKYRERVEHINTDLVKAEAEKLAAKFGLDPQELLAEAEAILKGEK